MRVRVAVALALALAQRPPSPLIIGLWDVPSLQPDQTATSPVPVRSDPSPTAPVVATLDDRGITPAGAAALTCSWTRDLEQPAAPRGCRFTESGYEIGAVAVFEQRNGWLRLAVDDEAARFGWIAPGGEFHSLVDLLATDQLTYMTRAWDRLLYAAPGDGPASPRRAIIPPNPSGTTAEVSYRPIEHAVVGDRLWLRVELIDGVCVVSDPKVVDTGWVPAQSPSGDLWAWFWSRGC